MMLVELFESYDDSRTWERQIDIDFVYKDLPTSFQFLAKSGQERATFCEDLHAFMALGYERYHCIILSCKNVLRKNAIFWVMTLKMVAACLFETSVNT
jgi:hypothetical protein